MTRIAVVGGGIAGLAAAYELEQARKRGADIDWQLYEASNRLGGIVETTRHSTANPDGSPAEYILEGGPDGWVSDKPWARELAVELGLEGELIVSHDSTRKTYIHSGGKLQAIPDGLRMMVPQSLDALAHLESSPLFSTAARAAYAAEPARAEELKAAAPQSDEAVSSFVLRHFGAEVLEKIGAPLLSGVFGGDVSKLSVRSVMAPFVAMEKQHGSLILALDAKQRQRGDKSAAPIFTSLRRGTASLVEELVARLPAERLHLNHPALSLKREGKLWCLRYGTPSQRDKPGKSKKHFKHVLLATPIDATRALLLPRDAEAAALIPTEASSAVLAAFAWSADVAAGFSIPSGFGFLVPQSKAELHGDTPGAVPHLLAGTFVDQKFPNRAPAGARIVRAFFGTGIAEHFAGAAEAKVAALALVQLAEILGPLPPPAITEVRRWPRSLPQYEVGHGERMEALDRRLATLPGLALLGNGYRGVGLPDLIRDSRAAACSIVQDLSSEK